MKTKNNIRLCVAFILLLSVVCCIAFSVGAADIGPNEFVNFNNYASYRFTEDNSVVNIEVSFPEEWNETFIDQPNPENHEHWFYGNEFTITDTVMPWLKINMHPLGGNMGWDTEVGEWLYDCRFIDLRYFPVGTVFTYRFNLTTSQYDLNLGDQVFMRYFFFVDSSGKVVDIGIHYFEPIRNGMGSYTWTESIKFGTFPKEAVGFAPLFVARNLDYALTDVTVSLSSFEFTFPMSAVQYQVNQNEQMQTTMDNIESAMDDLPGEIGDEFENVIDQEKEESKQEGNKFVDQVLDKLPDPSQGVLSALGELTAAVGYTGTEAVIPFPAIVIPGIDGLFDEIVIYDGSDFDLGSCVSYIPENILTVIQSLFTIAIVLYCVYELKGIISFIFTLKEKNNG